MCIAIVCKPGCDVMNFEAKLIFLIKSFFLHDQKCHIPTIPHMSDLSKSDALLPKTQSKVLVLN